ncbi:MAG: asparagine synthase-related protein [Elusimicrobia bacterium]|nr:asparagine synthase-related protein [Elusimicrobiota bacterium]
MSAIFGLIYLDGRPVTPERLEIMRRALKGWGPDGIVSRIKGCAGMGYANLHTTPEARYETMPWEDPDSGILITAAARLDNRDELCDLFHIPAPERPAVPDGRLVALAFSRWGDDTPSRLFGDWSFAAWDQAQRRLFVARDQLGNTGLFYCHKHPFFAFASSPQAILTLPEFSVKLDEWQLARYLVIFPGAEKGWSHTFWEDVRSLLPAHSMTVTPQTLQLRKYWRIDDAPVVRLGSDKDYMEGFMDHFRRAVRVRLRSDRPIGTTLSAGLDSGSVTALAAEALQGAGQTLAAFTSVPLYPAEHLVPGALADEWPLARTVAEKYKNIRHIPINASGVSPVGAIRDSLDVFGCPLHAAGNLYWLQAITSEARRQELGVLLTGQMGNGTVSWSGGRNRIFFLLAGRHWDEGFSALRTYRQREGCSWYRTMRRHLLSPLLGPLWRRRRLFVHPSKQPWGEYSAILPAFARRMDLQAAMRREDHDPFFAAPMSPEQERRLTIEQNSPGLYIHHGLGAAAGLDVRDPTADVRLLMFCLGVPEEKHSSGGGERMLLRRAMCALPDEVRWNTARGKQAADVGRRLLDHREEMEEELQALASHRSVPAYVDCGSLQSAWKELQTEVTPHTNHRAASLLLRGVMAGRFIMNSLN